VECWVELDSSSRLSGAAFQSVDGLVGLEGLN
jgi:hypothetical protein